MQYKDELYTNLMNLCLGSEAFFFKDFALDSRLYRIFNYRLASWTEFQQPSAMDCRGTMFDITTGTPELVSFPMPKFFNYEEGTIDHTLGTMRCKMEKLDGSLISTYMHNGELRLKSKASLSSSQAVDAMKLLNSPEYSVMKQQLVKLVTEDDVTVNMEYTAPTNRVVVPYQDTKLRIISVRSHDIGVDAFGESIKSFFMLHSYDALINALCPYTYVTVYGPDQVEYVEQLRQEQTGEGYVIEITTPTNAYRVKVKNHTYLTLHQAKDGAQNPKRLFEAVIDEVTDDLRSLFANDEYVLNLISSMEQKVVPVYNHIIKTVEEFYATNKHLDRKEYALLAQKHGKLMSLMMNLYIKRDNDYKAFAKKNIVDIFGVTGDASVDAE